MKPSPHPVPSRQSEGKNAMPKKHAAIRPIQEVLPLTGYDETLDAAVMEDGSLCDCLRIRTKDLNSISAEDVLRDNLIWEKLYKTYPGDLSILFFSYPAETGPQQRYLEHKLQTVRNPIYRKFLKGKLQELKQVHALYRSRGAVLLFYAKNPAEHRTCLRLLEMALLQNGRPLTRRIHTNEKKALFFRLCNKNMNQ